MAGQFNLAGGARVVKRTMHDNATIAMEHHASREGCELDAAGPDKE